MRDLTPPELKDYLENLEQAPLLLDVRQPWEYELCKLDDSVLIPMGEIPTTIDDLDEDRETVVICHHGVRSMHIARFLERSGFTNIINLKGGMDQWARTVDINMATY